MCTSFGEEGTGKKIAREGGVRDPEIGVGGFTGGGGGVNLPGFGGSGLSYVFHIYSSIHIVKQY